MLHEHCSNLRRRVKHSSFGLLEDTKEFQTGIDTLIQSRHLIACLDVDENIIEQQTRSVICLEDALRNLDRRKGFGISAATGVSTPSSHDQHRDLLIIVLCSYIEPFPGRASHLLELDDLSLSPNLAFNSTNLGLRINSFLFSKFKN